MRILAIETSCDETGIAVLEIKGRNFKLLSNIVSSQVKIHAEWGGVVPNLARREHQANLIPVLKKALKQSNLLIPKSRILNSKQIPNSKFQIPNTILEREPELLKKLLPFLKKYQAPRINYIAVTNGPGLEPALWVGVNFAKALSITWDVPIIPINHLEGHLFSVFLKEFKNPKSQILNSKQIPNSKFQIPEMQFPIIALLVSGGHTQLLLIKNWLKYKLLGETLDDAAGEAFDKVAKMLELGYPGGPAIAKAAEGVGSPTSLSIEGSRTSFKLPRPMLNSKDYNFSFSGLKTAVLYKLRDLGALNKEIKTEMSREFQQAVIDVLISKTIRAAGEYKAKTIILGGGVTANTELRNQFSNQQLINNRVKLLMPEIKFTGDNGAMIALAAYFRLQKRQKPINTNILKAAGNLELV